MLFYQSSGGYTGASYHLKYQDGRTEYFDQDGRIIAITDRFGNDITFAYTYTDASRKKVTKITITDTLGHTILYQNDHVPSDTVSYPAGHQGDYDYRYNQRWSLSLCRTEP